MTSLDASQPPASRKTAPGQSRSRSEAGHGPGDSRSHEHGGSHQHGSSHEHGHGQGHGHVHSEESRRRIINRLSRIEGHIRGIKTMVHEDRDCPDVLVQVAAVRGALDRVARLILDEHLSECVSRAAANNGAIDDEIAALKVALDRFLA